jgi:general secretion pathway protein A
MTNVEKVKNFFGFFKMPFTHTIEVNDLYISSSFDEAVTRLSFALETEKISILTGDSGSGKSCVLRHFVNSIDSKSYKAIYIPVDTDTKISDIAKLSLSELQMPIPFYSKTALRIFRENIIDFNNNKGIKPVLIIDEVQELEPNVLIALKTLLNFHMDSKNYLFVILSGQKSFLQHLDLFTLESLKRRIRIDYYMSPLTLAETSEYIKHELKKCGLERSIFPDDVVANIFNSTKGNISSINNLCFNCIIVAASKSKDIIDQGICHNVITHSVIGIFKNK